MPACPRCDGTGRVWEGEVLSKSMRGCRRCNGTGEVLPEVKNTMVAEVEAGRRLARDLRAYARLVSLTEGPNVATDEDRREVHNAAAEVTRSLIIMESFSPSIRPATRPEDEQFIPGITPQRNEDDDG